MMYAILKVSLNPKELKLSDLIENLNSEVSELKYWDNIYDVLDFLEDKDKKEGYLIVQVDQLRSKYVEANIKKAFYSYGITIENFHKCSITRCIMKEAVMLVESGQTYDKIAIQRHLASVDSKTDPITNKKLQDPPVLKENYNVISAIDTFVTAWKKSHKLENIENEISKIKKEDEDIVETNLISTTGIVNNEGPGEGAFGESLLSNEADQLNFLGFTRNEQEGRRLIQNSLVSSNENAEGEMESSEDEPVLDSVDERTRSSFLDNLYFDGAKFVPKRTQNSSAFFSICDCISNFFRRSERNPREETEIRRAYYNELN